MSAWDSRRQSLAGLTLDDVLANQKKINETAQQSQLCQQIVPRFRNRTLLDIIKEDESNKKDRRSWKAFKDKLRLKRAGSAWISTIGVPTSDILISHPNSTTFTPFGRRNSVRQTHSISAAPTHYMANEPYDFDPSDSPPPASAAAPKPQFARRTSTRFSSAADAPFTAGDPTEPAPPGGLRPQLSRRNSTNVPSASEPFRRGRVVTFRDSMDDDEPEDEEGLHAGRALSAREAVAAQEAAEAAAAAERESEEEAGPVTMSLMDLLSETDREMGLEGSRYILSDDEDFYDDDEEDDEGQEGVGGMGEMEYTCSVCMVRHKASSVSHCGHSYCRMCSRELSVTKGNCPLCNNFISEIIEIF